MQQNYIIKVRVCDPVVKEGHPNYISYTIVGEDKMGQFEVSKRYSNFCQLRDKWVQSWPGCYIPTLPQKIFKGNFDNRKISERMKMLDHFLNQIILQPHLWYSDEMNSFLRENDPQLAKPSLLERYNQAFPDLQEYQVDENLDIKIEQFHLFLMNARPILLNFKERLKLHKKISAECCEQMNIFYDFFLPQYEDLFLRQYTSKDNLPYTQSIQQEDILQNKQKKEVNEFLLQIRFEINEQNAIIKMIEDRKTMKKTEENQRNQLKQQVDELGRIQSGKFGLWVQLISFIIEIVYKLGIIYESNYGDTQIH